MKNPRYRIELNAQSVTELKILQSQKSKKKMYTGKYHDLSWGTTELEWHDN